MIEIKNAYKNFKDLSVLTNLNLSVEKGQILGILGKNGAGKTTLLKLICGLEKADSGIIQIGDGRGIRKKMGVSLTEGNQLISEMDGFTYLNFIGRIYKMPINELNKSIHELSEYFEFIDVLYSPIIQYSTGTKKKISLCASFIHKPQVLLLDEPFESLDEIICRRLIDFLKSFYDQNKTIVITSNQIDYLLEIATRVGIIVRGSFVEYSINAHSNYADLKNKILSEI